MAAQPRKSLADPYAGRRWRAVVDEDRLVLRYTRDRWSLSACRAGFGLPSADAVKSILRRHGVELRGAPVLDEGAVLRCYERLGGVQVTAKALGRSYGTIAAVLDRHQVPHSAAPRPRVKKAAR